MRSSGIVHTPWSKSTSSQVALVSSLLRTNVKKNQPQGKPTMDVCEGTLSIMVNAIPISRRQRALPRLKHGNRSRHQALVAKLANSNRAFRPSTNAAERTPSTRNNCFEMRWLQIDCSISGARHGAAAITASRARTSSGGRRASGISLSTIRPCICRTRSRVKPTSDAVCSRVVPRFPSQPR